MRPERVRRGPMRGALRERRPGAIGRAGTQAYRAALDQRWRIAGLLTLVASAAFAQDADHALETFRRAAPPAAVRAAPPDGLEWERRLRSPNSFGPPALRPVDADLLAAARASSWAEVLRLVKAGGAAVNARDDIGGNAFVLAARAGQDELMREFLKRGVDMDRTGEDGFTALGAAAFAGRRGTVRLLLLAGADPERFSASGQTALHLASVAGQVGVLDELLRLKVDIDLLNRQRETALDVAASAGQQESMGRLLEGGANTSRAGQR